MLLRFGMGQKHISGLSEIYIIYYLFEFCQRERVYTCMFQTNTSIMWVFIPMDLLFSTNEVWHINIWIKKYTLTWVQLDAAELCQWATAGDLSYSIHNLYRGCRIPPLDAIDATGHAYSSWGFKGIDLHSCHCCCNVTAWIWDTPSLINNWLDMLQPQIHIYLSPPRGIYFKNIHIIHVCSFLGPVP